MSWLRAKAFGLWLRFGHRIYGMHYMSIYAPKGELVAITLSRRAEYIDRVADVELDGEELGQ